MTATHCAGAATLWAFAIAHAVMAQSTRPSFDIVSVKPSVTGGFPDFKPKISGNRVTMHNVRVPTIVIYAYHLAAGAVSTSYQLAGKVSLPEGSDLFDIDAVAPGMPGEAEIRLMFQSLLEDRFQLKYHWENRNLPVYEMTIAKNGPKLKVSDPNQKMADARRADEEPGVSLFRGSLPMEVFIQAISARLDMPVRNLTGITGGMYDFDFYWARDVNVTTAAPNLVRAVEESLGLKLKPGTGPIPVLVVDHLTQPSQN